MQLQHLRYQHLLIIVYNYKTAIACILIFINLATHNGQYCGWCYQVAWYGVYAMFAGHIHRLHNPVHSVSRFQRSVRLLYRIVWFVVSSIVRCTDGGRMYQWIEQFDFAGLLENDGSYVAPVKLPVFVSFLTKIPLMICCCRSLSVFISLWQHRQHNTVEYPAPPEFLQRCFAGPYTACGTNT